MNEDQLNIGRYLDGDMPDDECLAFESRLENEAALKAQLDEEREERLAMRLLGQASMYQQVREIAQASRRGRKRRRWAWGGSAAAVVALLGLLLFRVVGGSGDLTRRYLDRVNFVPDVKLGPGGQQKALKRGHESYEKGEYEIALGHLDSVPRQSLDRLARQNAGMMVAVCHMQLRQYPEAEAVLLELEAGDPREILPWVQWYHSLNLLALGRKEEARSKLDQLIAGQRITGEWKAAALELREELQED